MVLYHLGGALASAKYFNLPALSVPFSFGHSGVAFFFVLSGFIITYAHWNDVGKGAEITSYLRKRIIRIYPPFLIVFSAVYAMAWCSSTLRESLPANWEVIFKALLLVPQDQALVGGTGAPVLIVAWSLHYEIIFYAFFALAIIDLRLAVAAIAGLMVNSLLCVGEAGCTFPRSFFASYWFVLFFSGVGIACLVRRRIRVPRPLWVVAAGAGGFLFTGILEIYGSVSDLMKLHLSYGLCSSAMIWGAVVAEDLGVIDWRSPVIRALGDSSYALYLVHYPLISILCKTSVFIGLNGWSGALIAFAVILLLCVLIAHFFYRGIERPILAWLANATPRIHSKK